MKSAIACSGALALGLLLSIPAQAQQRAPGLVPRPASAEAGLWDLANRAELGARNSSELNSDPTLSAYVRDVTCSIAADYCDELRIYVMDRPMFNASAFPNGYLEVWSGLLLRADSSAELAFVIGHEIGHYAENHSIEQWQLQKVAATAAMVLTVGVAVAGAYYQVDVSSLGDVIYLSAVSGIMSFSRSQETQSDEIGQQRMAASGYDPVSAAQIWRNLQDETAASSFPSVRRREAANTIFRSHPLTATRIATLERLAPALAGDQAGSGRVDRERHRAAIRPFLGRWLDDELNLRDFNGLLHLIDRLSKDGEDLGVLNFYRGEIYRQRRQDGDLALALDAYERATGHIDAPVAAWREMGNVSQRLGLHDKARDAWAGYILHAPDADDLWIVEDSLKSLDKDA